MADDSKERLEWLARAVLGIEQRLKAMENRLTAMEGRGVARVEEQAQPMRIPPVQALAVAAPAVGSARPTMAPAMAVSAPVAAAVEALGEPPELPDLLEDAGTSTGRREYELREPPRVVGPGYGMGGMQESGPIDQMEAQRAKAVGRAAGETLENKIGLKVAAWLGGLAVVLGVLFFLKLAWDQQWFRPTPVMRVSIGMFFGLALLGVGEWVLVKKMRVLAGALHGAGVAVLMGSFFAGHVAFDPPVFPRTAAFVGVLCVGILGIGLALHVRAMALAIIAQIGMYVSPAILGSDVDASAGFLGYLAVVTAMGVGVAFFKRRWHAVRWLAFVCTWGWVLGWLGTRHMLAHRELAWGACGGFFAIFLAEMVGSLHRGVRGPPEDEGGVERRESPNAEILVHQMAVGSFFNTAIAFGASWSVFWRLELPGVWIAALAFAGAMALVMLATPAREFAVAAALQAAALVTVAVPLYFSGTAITLAWGAMSAALAVYAYVTRSVGARSWAFAILLLVAGRVVTFDVVDAGLNVTQMMIGRQPVTWWMLLALGAAAYGHVVAWLSRPRSEQTGPSENVRSGSAWMAIAAGVVGTGLFVVAGLRLLESGAELTAGYALALATFAFFARGAAAAGTARVGALILLVAACGRIALIDSGNALMRLEAVRLGTETLPRWVIVGWATALAAQGMAWLARPRAGAAGEARMLARGVAAAMAGVGTVCFAWSAVGSLSADSPLTLALLAWLFLLMTLASLVSGVGYSWQAAGLLAILVMKWAAVDSVGAWVWYWESPMMWSEEAGWPVVNWFTASAVLIFVAVGLLRLGWDERTAALHSAKAWVIGVMTFLWLNVEAVRAVDWLMRTSVEGLGSPWIVKNVTLSVLWAVVGFGLVISGFARKAAALRWVGLALLGITVLKVLLVDMANVDTVLRVLSFIVLGMLLLGVSFVYHKQVARRK